RKRSLFCADERRALRAKERSAPCTRETPRTLHPTTLLFTPKTLRISHRRAPHASRQRTLRTKERFAPKNAPRFAPRTPHFAPRTPHASHRKRRTLHDEERSLLYA